MNISSQYCCLQNSIQNDRVYIYIYIQGDKNQTTSLGTLVFGLKNAVKISPKNIANVPSTFFCFKSILISQKSSPTGVP